MFIWVLPLRIADTEHRKSPIASGHACRESFVHVMNDRREQNLDDGTGRSIVPTFQIWTTTTCVSSTDRNEASAAAASVLCLAFWFLGTSIKQLT